MLTVLGSGLTSASPGELALSAAIALLFAGLGYRMSARHRALRGVTPWRLPSIAWAVVCLVLQFLGIALEVVAEMTTRTRYSPANPPATPGRLSSRYSPPAVPPVALEPPSAVVAGGRQQALLASVTTEDAAAPTFSAVDLLPPPPVDEAGRPAPFGWYPDPRHRHELRYFDGRQWNDHVVDAGQVAVDPV